MRCRSRQDQEKVTKPEYSLKPQRYMHIWFHGQVPSMAQRYVSRCVCRRPQPFALHSLCYGMFHCYDMLPRSVPSICFTICLFISPDLDGYRAYIDPARPTIFATFDDDNALLFRHSPRPSSLSVCHWPLAGKNLTEKVYNVPCDPGGAKVCRRG